MGYPISEPFQETSAIDGKTYLAQYFERADLELHPENAAPLNVMPALLGDSVYNAKYPGGAPNQQASTVNPVKFEQTGKTLGGDFRNYWEANGGLAQAAAIPSQMSSRKSLHWTATPAPVQYFERAEFELHPQSQPSGYGMADLFAPTNQTGAGNRVMRSQLGLTICRTSTRTVRRLCSLRRYRRQCPAAIRTWRRVRGPGRTKSA